MFKRLKRLWVICRTIHHFGLLALLYPRATKPWQKLLLKLLPTRDLPKETLPIRVRLTLEALGPVFVKFGQVLSTRPDIIPGAYAKEFALLQDNVPAFDSHLAIEQIEKSLGKSIHELYASFNPEPFAAASVAQVHEAHLFDVNGEKGEKVAVKILRPGLAPIIEQDLALMYFGAWLVEKLFTDGRRLKPRAVISEFDRYLHEELDLMNEAANAALLRRQFAGSQMLIVPQVYYDFCSRNVLTIEWMEGIPISNRERLVEQGIDLKKLARFGVEIFFTQVFDNGFFHADMHPGNIMVADDGRYIALDFGIIGTLNEYDKRYLAINFLAFFNRDYHRVATAHIESGWAPENTRVDELEAAVRRVCEPIFNKPLSQISFGLVLMRLFETSRRFNVEIQPQLVLLQKTLLNIEGLGRQLDPDLDLWKTAKPFLARWVNKQVGLRGFLRNLKDEVPTLAHTLPSLPRRLNQLLDTKHQQNLQAAYLNLIKIQHRQNIYLGIMALFLLIITLSLFR